MFFSQDLGENNWQVNVNPGTPTGNQPAILAFANVTDTGKHRLRLVADGKTVEVFLDGISGGKYPFEANSGIFFELGAYARATDDTVTGVFDNVKIENTLPCTSVVPSGISMTLAETGQQVTLTIPQFLNDSAPVVVTVTSRDPKVAVPSGGASGVLTLTFAAGAANTQTFTVAPVGLGSTTFDLASNPPNCVASALPVEVVAVPKVLLTDDFAAATIDQAKWKQDDTAFDSTTPGTATADSAITLASGQVKISVTAETANWPGLALYTVQSYSPGPTTPVTFEIDRAKLDFVLVTGTGAYERTGVWVKDAQGNFLLFSDNVAHDGRNFGWRYNRMIGGTDDNPTGDGVNIAAFDGPLFNDQKNHRIKIVVNGSTAKLYLDGVFGTEVAFPFSQGLSFGFGAYVAAATDIVYGYFDNAKITGGSAPVPPSLTATRQGGNVVITWTSTGILQVTDSLATPINWTDVTPPPTGNSHTVTPAGPNAHQYYRVKQ